LGLFDRRTLLLGPGGSLKAVPLRDFRVLPRPGSGSIAAMRARLFALGLLFTLVHTPLARAGGGPMNVMVVYSKDDPKAAGVAAYYEKARSLPMGHLCGLSGFTPADTTIDGPTFLTKVLAPLDACLAALPQPEEVDALVLVRGLPYSVTLPTYPASFEAVLQVGHAKHVTKHSELAGADQPKNQPSLGNPRYVKSVEIAGDYTISNPYQNWYGTTGTVIRAKAQPPSFRRANAGKSSGYDYTGQLFIVSSLDGFDYEDAKALVDRAVQSDGTLPTAEILCMHAEDEARGARDPECELATRMLKSAGFAGNFLSPFDPNLAGHTLAGYFTGSADSERGAIAGNTFVPGAITDNLTSYGAVIPNFACSSDGMTCPAGEVQTSVARFVRAGATGAHGTVNEPYNNTFPNAGALLHYTFGYSLGESYLFNQRYLYWQNVHLGDPLATPYAVRPAVTFDGMGAHPRNVPLVIHAKHTDGVAKVDLFSSGKRVASAMGDTLSYDLTETIGEKLDLLAVATAVNAPVMRAGWPAASQLPQPDVQGWATFAVEVAPDEAAQGGGGAGGAGGAGGGSVDASSSSGAPAEATDAGGCAWTSQPASDDASVIALGALAMVILGRRRAAR